MNDKDDSNKKDDEGDVDDVMMQVMCLKPFYFSL